MFKVLLLNIKKMTIKSPETLETRESGTAQELKDLKLDISDRSENRKRFDALSKDSVLKNWLNKLYDKSCKLAFSEEWKEFEKLDIWKTLENIMKQYPSLWLEICWDLWLSLSESKFSKLSLQQKLNFTELYSSVYWKSIFYKKNPSSQDIISRIKQNNEANFNKINRLFERKNVKNFLQLEKTLKDFGLNSSEIWKIKEYLQIIKKHPEFIWINKPNEAWNRIWYAIFLLVGVVLWALWMHYIDNIGKINPETTTRLDWVTTIENAEKVLRLLTQQSDFERSWSTKIEMFKIDEDDWTITSFVKDWVNKIQSKEIEMELSWKLAMQFDLDKWCKIDVDVKNWKGVAYVQLPQPDVIITNSKAKVLSENREWVHLSEFDQAQENLRQELEQKAISDAKNDPNFYEKWKKDVEKQLYDLLSALHPDWVDITSVKVRFFNPDEWPKNFIDPEGRSIVNFK